MHDPDELFPRLKAIHAKKKVLDITLVTEKPSVSFIIASVLSKNTFKTASSNGFPLHYFSGHYKGLKANFWVLATYGHIYK